jgi:hypothetical protein
VSSPRSGERSERRLDTREHARTIDGRSGGIRALTPHADPLLPLLIRIIAAAHQAAAGSDEHKGHSAALAAFGKWALTAVPTRGVLAPSTAPDHRAIEAIAVRHLNFRAARRAVQNARAVMKGCAGLNDLESAENCAGAVSDIAYYYAGLAAGIVLAELAAR